VCGKQASSSSYGAELLLAAGRGDKDAYHLLWLRYRNAVRGWLAGWIPAAVDPEDALQEVALRLWQKAGAYDPARGHPATYLMLITREVARNIRRNQDKWPQPLVSSPAAPAEDREPGDLSAAAGELLELVFRCGGFPHQTISLALRHLLGFPPRESIKRFANESLSGLTGRVLAALKSRSGWSEEEARRILNTHIWRLSLPAGKVYRNALPGRVTEHERTGSLPLETFFGKDPAHSLEDWSSKVKARVKRVLQEGCSPARCRLACPKREEVKEGKSH